MKKIFLFFFTFIFFGSVVMAGNSEKEIFKTDKKILSAIMESFDKSTTASFLSFTNDEYLVAVDTVKTFINFMGQTRVSLQNTKTADTYVKRLCRLINAYRSLYIDEQTGMLGCYFNDCSLITLVLQDQLAIIEGMTLREARGKAFYGIKQTTSSEIESNLDRALFQCTYSKVVYHE
jgi:hypothetical protein